jgi:acyl-CoA reductase-like NAD-dependent aldehyde dehydrogenase
MHQRDKLFINGRWVAPAGHGSIEVIEASTEQVMGSVSEGDDADAAVAAARAAFEAWSATMQFDWEHTVGHSRVLREAVGVVACITPWNYPLHQSAAKLGAALRPRRPGQRLLRPTDRVRPGPPGQHDRAGRNLWTGAVDHHLP